MADENKDLNNGQSVATQDLKDADPVNQQDLNNPDSVNQQSQDDKLADGTSKDKSVPYLELEKATQAKKKAEEDAAFAQRQLEVMQANQQPIAQPQQGSVAKSTYEQAMIDEDVTADELYGEALVRVENRKAALDKALQQYNTAFQADRQFIATHLDFNTVVGSVNPATGQIMAWSVEALQLQQAKPYLAGAFQSAQGAYDAVMAERQLKELEKKVNANEEHKNRQNADNASAPLGGSAAGGAGGGDTQNQPMMTREQIREIQERLDNGEENI